MGWARSCSSFPHRKITQLGMVLHVWAALECKIKSGICTLANCFCYICHTIPLARVHGALIQCAAAGRFDTGQVHGKSNKLTQQNHVASGFLHVPLGGPAPAAASLSPGLTPAAAGLLLPSVTGSAETVMRPSALASAICKDKKGSYEAGNFTRYWYQTCFVNFFGLFLYA